MELVKSYEPAIARMQELGMDIIQIKKEVSFALQHMNKNQKLQDCSPQSKMAAVVNIANIGLTLNPAAKEAYLIPRYLSGGFECVLEPSYIGLVKLLTDTGSVKGMICHLVYENDQFAMDIADNRNPISHKPELSNKKRGELLGVYALATLPNGERQAEWMDVEDIYNIRERSETYKAFKAGKIKSCTWATDESEMMRKTVIKRIYKYLPRTDRMKKIDQAIKLDNSDYGITDSQCEFIENLLSSSTLDHDRRADIEHELHSMTAQRAGEVIEYLKNNQLDPITQGNGYNQTDIANHTKRLHQ